MATKNHVLSDKADIGFGELSCDQYRNLNLNQNYHSLHADNLQSKSAIKNSRKSENYGFSESIDSQGKKETSLWKKSNKHLSPNFLHRNKESEEKHEFKKSKNSNSSTLSLHIAAYENSVDADSDESNAGETEDLKSKNEGKALIDSSSFITNPFEFPRQQGQDGNKHPEVMQFKASRRLRNPNEDNLTDDEKDSDELSSVETKSVDQQQQSDHREIGSVNTMDAANKEEEVKTSETHSDVDDDAKTSEKESVSATVSDDENCNEKIAAVSDAAEESPVETSTPPAEEILSSEPPTSSASTSANSIVPTNFDTASFDDFLAKFLDTDSSKLDDHEIRAFAVTIPKTFILTEDRYQTVFKVLFKIKEIEKKAVYNDSLALVQRCFENLDFNKFLLQFWNCDEFKDRELGPIGYSFTEGSPRYDFSGVAASNNDIVTINAKAVDAAWSMLLDVEATVNAMLNTYMTDKPMSVFYLIILRRFKCLGDYKVKLGKETPLFLYFFRKLIADLKDHELNIALSCLVSVCWSPKGHYCWALMKPNYALCEIMNHLVRDDETHPAYMLALRRLYTPISGFRCDIEWNADSKDFDNQALFLIHFIKYYNRKQSINNNIEVFNIFNHFKASMRHGGRRITNLGSLEECVEVDWPFAYAIVNFLDIQNFKRQIPESIFKALPETEVEKYVSIDEPESSLENALIGLMELYFLCDPNYQIPDAFYKNLWTTHAHPKSIIDLFARSIVKAYNNLKSSFKIQIDKRLIDFVSRISQYCLDYNLVESFSCASEMNFDLISRCNHLIVIARTLRLIIEEKYTKDGRRPAFQDLPNFFFDLFRVFSMKTRDKFADIRSSNEGLWQPWRRGSAPCMDDEKSMAINHFLNAIQKEAFCMYDSSSYHNEDFLDFLLFLQKQRKFHGVTYPKLEMELRAKYPYFFEPADSSHNDRMPQQHREDNRSTNPPPPQQQQRDSGSMQNIQNRGPNENRQGRGPTDYYYDRVPQQQQRRDRGQMDSGRQNNRSPNPPQQRRERGDQMNNGRSFTSSSGRRPQPGNQSAA